MSYFDALMDKAKYLTIKSYDQTAEDYADKVKDFFLEEEAEKFFSYLKKGDLILDLGCGSGRDARIFTERGYRVVGVDLSEKLLEIAGKEAPRAEFKLMDIANLEFNENQFNGVWAVASLLHLPKKEIPDVLESIYEILKPNGILYVSVKKGEGEIIKPDPRYKNAEKFWSFFQGSEMISFLEKSNFAIIDSNVTSQDSNYATNPWINIFCRK